LHPEGCGTNKRPCTLEGCGTNKRPCTLKGAVQLEKNMIEPSQELASMLLEIGAVKLSPNKPFTWASGWFSPIYCDNRLVLSYPQIRNFIKRQFVELVKSKYPLTEVIAGVATAGVPHGMLLADALNLPFIYVRPKPKEHGMENLIEGKVEKGAKVLVVEDLISTGGSSIKAAKAVENAGMQVIGMLAIFNYDFEVSQRAMTEADITLSSLCSYQNLLIEAVANDYVGEDEMASLQAWRNSPETWKK
jgi:orotate phosphoribosyltransferase